MRSLVTRVHADQERLIDLVGTGGDGANLFNVSTAATFVVAAAGAGSQSMVTARFQFQWLLGRSQSLGVPWLSPEGIASSIEQIGMGLCSRPPTTAP